MCVCVYACVRVCVYVCLFVRASLSVCLSLASDSSENIGHNHETWHGICLRHGNASRVNYVDLDLHSKFTKIFNMKKIHVRLFHKLFKQSPSNFAHKIVRLKVYVIFSQSDDLTLHSRSQR